MKLGRRFPGMQYGVIRQGLAEIRHPARSADGNHLLAHDALHPVPSVRIAQVKHGGAKIGVLDQIGATVRLTDEIVFVQRLFEQVPLATTLGCRINQKGVYIGHDPYFLAGPVVEQAFPVRIMVAVKFPVPPELFAHDGGSLADPVLQPEGGHGRFMTLQRLPDLARFFRAALHADHGALEYPVRQGTHAADGVRVCANQRGGRVARQDAAGHVRAKQTDLHAVACAQIKDAVGVGFEKKRAHGAGDIVRCGGIGGVPRAARLGDQVHEKGKRLTSSSNALFHHEHRHASALEIEMGELRAESVKTLILIGGVVEEKTIRLFRVHSKGEAEPIMGARFKAKAVLDPMLSGGA